MPAISCAYALVGDVTCSVVLPSTGSGVLVAVSP
jgi:hypothetical protein